MSNLKLVADEPTAIERMLLDASRAELPSDDHKARLRAALGIGMPLPGPLTAPGPPAAPPVAAAANAPAADSVTKSAPWTKLAFGVGMLGVAGALWLSQRQGAVETPRRPAPAPQLVTVVPVAPPAPVAEAPQPEVSPLPLVKAPVSAPRARTEASAAGSDLSEQIRLIEAARAGVASQDVKAALSALDAYAAKFPRGSFGQEALVLRIRAVDQAGDSARASAMAKSFIARFPSSPHVARLKPIAERSASR
jgi:Outer membrane lipoprotein